MFILALPTMALTQININWETSVDVAPESFGYTNLRMELDSDGLPVILHGKSGNDGGLYCTRWNGASFNEPVAVTTEVGLFINDAEGPRMAISGDRVAVSYQLSGQWANGGRIALSEDGGVTWETPIAIAPNATEDHFMPVPSFDSDQEPWLTVKWGSNPVLEGAMFWDEANSSFLPPVDAGETMAGDAACECCASMPFSHDGRHYDVVRNNNDNIRDFWMVRTDAAGNWSESLDIDPTNWSINSCPASEAETCILSDGTLLAVFMSAAEGGSRVYWSTADLEGWSLMGSDRIDPSSNHVENHPSVHAHQDHSVVAWESNQGGYKVMVATGSGTFGAPEEWSTSATSVTENLSGHSRRPVIRIDENKVHLVYQRPSEGTIHYVQGTLESSTGVAPSQSANMVTATLTHEGWYIAKLQDNFNYAIHDLGGRLVSSGRSKNGHVPFSQSGVYILVIDAASGAHQIKLFR